VKRLGLIGGVGPESTIAYYRAILKAVPCASLVINSVDVQQLVRWMTAGQLQDVADYFVREVDVLADAGATLGIITANTPHIVFDEVSRRTRLPLLSIVESARDHVRALGLRRVGLLGTRFTMQAAFYPEVFSRAGIEIVTPGADDQAYVHDKYLNELLKDVFSAETRQGILRVIERLPDVEAVILAGTELPLLLPEGTRAKVPLLDTTEIHVAAAVARLWGSGGVTA
jgi:aspartate racemase